MRRKYNWAWIVCLALMVCILSACSLFGGKKSETAQNLPIQEKSSSTAVAESSEQKSESKQSFPVQTIEKNKQDTNVLGSATEAELPEIEIPIMENNRDDGKDNRNESTVPEPSGESEPSSKPESTTVPTTRPSEPSNTPSNPGKPQTETPESNESRPTPEVPSEPSVNTSHQPEPYPKLEPDNNDIIINENRDILLPEVP